MDESNKTQELVNQIIEQINASEIRSIKTVMLNIISTLNNPGSTIKDLKDAIQLDPPLSAKVLRIANSAYYSPRSRIDELEKAVVWLGFSTVRELALSQKAGEMFLSGDSESPFSRSELWKHSVAVALFNKAFQRKEFGNTGENAYISGLLHQIGLIATCQIMPEKFSSILEYAETKKKNIFKAEQEILGIDHALIGKAIIENWGLSEEMSIAIGYHHQPYLSPKTHLRNVTTLYISDYICQLERIGFRDAPYPDEDVFEKSLTGIKTHFRSLETIAEEVKTQITKMAEEGLF